MEARISLVTLGVGDLEASTRFYRDALRFPQVDGPPDISFFELGRMWLALYPRQLLAADAGVSSEGGGFAGFTFAHNVRSPEEVDAVLRDVAANGARIVKSGQRADWGGYSGYFADPDGFLWEVAWAPGFPHL